MLVLVRIIVLSLLLGGTIIFGILPIWIRPYLSSCQCSEFHHKRCATRKQRLATCFLIFFGGGVLLSTCLVRLIHEVHETFNEMLDNCLEAERNHSMYLAIIRNLETQDTKHKHVAIDENEILEEIINEVATESVWNLPLDRYAKYYETELENGTLRNSALCKYVAKTSFPFPEFITACGFFLIYFVEELIKSIIRCYHNANSGSFDLSSTENSCESKNDALMLQKIRSISLTELENISSSNKITSNCPPLKKNKTVIENIFIKTSHISFGPLGFRDIKKSVKNLNFFYGYDDIRELNVEGLDDFITILALSFNSIFEGFAVGFQHTEISTWMLFFSIALHKYVSVFVISLETLNKEGSNVRVLSYIAIFSCMTPMGMLAAILTHNNLVDSSNFEIVILNSISVGTLFYVTFYEMLKQRKDYVEISGFSQFFVLLVGFIVMSVIEYFYTCLE